MRKSPTIAVDLGGTWIRSASVDCEGERGPLVRRPTIPLRPAGAIVNDIAFAIEEAVRVADVPIEDHGCLALAVPTVLDDRGRLAACDNLPTMIGLSLDEELRERFGLPVFQCNDATCFAAGEGWLGAGKGVETLIGVTLGTGIGLGLLLDGEPHRGRHGRAGEIWRSPWGEGKLEDFLCGPGLERRYRQRTSRSLSGSQIADRARDSEDEVCAVFLDFGEELGRVVAFLINVIDPDVVVLGGSVARSFEHFGDAVERVVSVSCPSASDVSIVPSQLWDEAGLVGAARLSYTVSFRD